MTRTRARVIAWSSVALTAATLPAMQMVLARPHPGQLGIEGEGSTPFAYVGLLAFSIVGALIVSRHPRHLVGWIFSLSGLAAGLSGVTTAYAQLGEAVPGSLPEVGLVDAISGLTFLVGFFAPISIGLLLFPDGRLPSTRWLPAVYAAIGALALQFIGALIGEHPIGYLLNYAGIAVMVATVLAAVASLAVRWQDASPDVRQQLKWVAVAGTLVFLVLGAELLVFIFRPSLIEPAFLYFSLAYTSVPVAVGIAILRYGLYEIDLIINRAIVYVSLTAILAGIYAGSTALFQRAFVALTGQSSDGAIVITVFILAAVFTPARNWLQVIVDRRFKDARDLKRLMAALEREVEAVIGVIVGRRLAERLLNDATEGTGATGAALYLEGSTADRPTLTFGNWDGQAELTVPLRNGEHELGRMDLGPRRTGARYSNRDLDRIQRTADTVAMALSLIPEQLLAAPDKARIAD
jgi:hypothetical protein